MTKYVVGFVCFFLLLASAAPATADTAPPPSDIIIVTSTPTPIPPPIVVSAPSALAISAVEPTTFTQTAGGVLTVLGTDFTADMLVRLVGAGVLQTTYYNATTLQATVPAGFPAGSYTVEVFNDVEAVTATTPIQIIAPPPPTALPATPAPPEPGELSVGAVEPSEVVKATGTTITVFGSGFTPEAIVRLVGVGALDTIYLSHNTLKAIVPPDLPPYQFDLQVIRGDDVATWGGKVTIFIPATATPQYSGVSSVLTKPQLLMQNTTFDHAPIRSGEPFTLTFDLVNVGQRDAQNIVMNFTATDVAVPAEGSNTRFIDRVQDGESGRVAVSVPLVARHDLSNGQYNLAFDFQFLDANGSSYSTSQNVGLTLGNVQAAASGQPRLVISTYETDAPIEPGGRFALQVQIDNVGELTAQNVVLTLGGENGSQLDPFALLNASNVAFIGTVSAGETLEFTRSLIVDGNAAVQPHILPLEIEYDDGGDNKITNPFVLSLLVESQPKLQIDFYRQPAIAFVNQPLDLPVEIVNIGNQLINVNTIVLETNPELVVEDGSLYAGPLDGGTSISLDGVVYPEAAGTLEVHVLVNYLDEFNQERQVSETLTLTVEEVAEGATQFDPETGQRLDDEAAVAETDNPNSTSLWFQIIGALLALTFIGLVIRNFRRRRAQA